MEELFNNPNRFDLMWKLGIDEDILDDNIRQIEVKNFVNKVFKTMIVHFLFYSWFLK